MTKQTHFNHYVSLGGLAIGATALAWVLWGIDTQRMAQVLSQAKLPFLVLLPVSIAAEQVVRGWKWRQLLYDIQPIGTLRLFGAVMAGYFATMVIPLGVSPLVRSWLIARLEALKMSAVLATALIERLVDGVVFSAFVAFTLAFAAFADPGGSIRLGLVLGGFGSLALFSLTLLGLALYKRYSKRADKRYSERADNQHVEPSGESQGGQSHGWVASLAARLIERLPARFTGRFKGLAHSFAEGIIWPRSAWRGVAIVLASIAIKLIAITHFLWAGLAFGVILRPTEYVFLVVFLGFLIIITRIARIPGGFTFGALFALDLLGIADEPALAMVVAVQSATLLTFAVIGTFALWKHGFTLSELRPAKLGTIEGT